MHCFSYRFVVTLVPLPFPQSDVYVSSWLEIAVIDTFTFAFAVVFVQEDIPAL